MMALSDQQCIELLCQLIAIPSVSFEEQQAADFLEQRLQAVFGNHVVRDENSVLIHLGPSSAEKRLLLCSHIDTVAPVESWTRNPFAATREGERIYGLGANDALSSCVAMVTALSRVQSDWSRVGVSIGLVAGEETGSHGFARIEPGLHYTSAIFGEPTEMKVATAMRGYMRVKLIGRGKSCHASRPWEGKNAITDLSHQLACTEALNLKDDSPWGQATIQPTIISGGTSHNQIPDAAEAVLDIRPTVAVHNDLILAWLADAGCQFEVIHNKRRPMNCDPESEVMQAIKRARPNPPTFAFGGTCDMAFSRAPSVVMGAGQSNRSHAADEFITESEMKEAAMIYQGVIEAFVQIASA